MENQNKIKFHIHIDAKHLPKNVEEEALKLGMYDTDFNGHPEGREHFEPNRHLTMKFDNYPDFHDTWEKLKDVVSESKDYSGYIEGEYIREKQYIEEKEFDSSIEVPFKLKRRKLDSKKGESFRETELHLVFDREKSDPRIIEVLMDSGLYGAFIPKDGYEALVLTAQGYRKDISEIVSRLKEYLNSAGGVVRASIKEEVAIKHFRKNMDITELPEIVESISF